MNIRKILVLSLFLTPLSAQSDALFGNDMAGDRDLPRTWGIGIDYFSMDQPYQFDGTPTISPPLPISDFSLVDLDNKIEHTDLKVDAWVLPFLNVFGVYGRIDGTTTVELRRTGLPVPTIGIDYDGDVFGGGITIAVGGERWFASLTATVTDTDLSGDLDSSVKATTIQPRVGLRFGNHSEFWIGGYNIDAEESHVGAVEVDLGPFLGGVQTLDVVVDLTQESDFNFSAGTHMMLSDAWEATVEVGGGDRSTVLANVTYRFE